MINKLIRKINKIKTIFVAKIITKLIPVTQDIRNEDSDYIISFTSYGKRIPECWMTIKSIMLQRNFHPRKIILWIAEADRKLITDRIMKYTQYGLEVRYCDDYKSYKKAIIAAKEFTDLRIITADDDLIYPRNHFSKLVSCSNQNPNCVCCYLAHEITFVDGKVAKYLEWNNSSIGKKGPSMLLVPIGCNGIVYPPNYFKDADLDYSAMTVVAPTMDDLWFRFIGIKKNVCVVKVTPDNVFVPNTPGTQKDGLFSSNAQKNDEAIIKLQEHFQIDIASLKEN